MAKAPNWTKEEIDILNREYPKQGCTVELQELLPGRCSNGISIKARRLGLSIKNNPRKRRTNEEYIALLSSSNFEALEEYSGSTTPIKHRCKVCNNIWGARPQGVLREGARCPNCDLNNRFNSIEKVDGVLSTAGFERLSEYTGALDKILLKHVSCGYRWTTTYSIIQQGSGCPICNKGFGYKVKEILPEVATLYLIEISTQDDVFLKVGVTVQPLTKRINSIRSSIGIDTTDIKVVHSIVSTGKDVLAKEAAILGRFSRYTSKEVFDGKTETLSIINNVDDIKQIMNENI